MKPFDVVIVGGGPAGSAAALQCRQAGLRVIILESEPFPRHRPGETLPPGIESLLSMLGVTSFDYQRLEGQWVAWEGPERFHSFGSDAEGPWLGFQAWREDFDALLLRCAASAGANVLQPKRAKRPACCGSRIIGVITDQGLLQCRFVLDASGSRHWLARHLELDFVYASPKLIATYGYAGGRLANGPARLDADMTGWTWIAQVKPDLVHWTRLNWSGQPSASGWIPQIIRSLRQVGPTRRADTTWRILAAPAGPGYFAVGDAAMVLDPSSSHGVLKAVMSGIMSAHLIAQHLIGDIPAEVIAARYNLWIADWFAHDSRRMRELYTRLPLPPNWWV